MDTQEEIKALKKELIELEQANMNDTTKPKAQDKVVSGFICIGVGLICLAYGIAQDITVSVISGFIALVFGIIWMVIGNTSSNSHNVSEASKRNRIVEIKKQLIDLE
jgi:uncharacterized membrane protein HdeD (DUF308 family)